MKRRSRSRLVPIRSDCICLVCKILQKGGDSYSEEEKRDMVSAGRPTPFLKLEAKIENTPKRFTRYFKLEFYEKYKWLTGCPTITKLFCWPCLLFNTNNGEQSLWNTIGFSDLNNVSQSVKKHVNTRGHLIGVIKEKTLIVKRANSDNLINYKSHNDLVSNNRNILKRLIDVVCLTGTRELTNCIDYMDLIELIAKYDETLRNHLKDSTAFRGAFGTSQEVQDNLIKSVGEVVVDSIKSEIKEAKFVSIIIDSNSNRLAIIVRYVKLGGTVQNRFLKFYNSTDFSDNRGDICKIFLDVAQELECKSKLIAYSYNGGVVPIDNFDDTQERMKNTFENGVFIHCFAHRLNSILSQSLSSIKDCKLFFSNLNEMGDFIAKSPRLIQAVDGYLRKRFPNGAHPLIQWNDNGKLAMVISQYRDILITVFGDILNETVLWEPEIVNALRGFLYLIENDFYFNFLLKVFSDIFTHTDLLSDIIQTKSNDIGFCVQNISSLQKRLNQKREQFQHFWDATMNIEAEPQFKRIKVEDLSETELYSLYFQILDTITQQITARFHNFNDLKFIELTNFARYDRGGFPEDGFIGLRLIYYDLFDFEALHSQLRALYASRNEINHRRTALDMLIFLKETGLDESYAQVLKLCYLVLTVPVMNPSMERGVPVLTRIETFNQNCQPAENSSSLALLSIEDDCVKNLAQHAKFYDEVIDKFARIEKGIELQYK